MRRGLPTRSPTRNKLTRGRQIALSGLALAVALDACGGRSNLDPGQVEDSPNLSGGRAGASGGRTTNGGGKLGAGGGGGQATSGGGKLGAGGGVAAGSGVGGSTAGSGGNGPGGGGPGGYANGGQGGEQPVTVTQIGAGGIHNCALFSDGSVKCWGSNSRGALGNGKPGNVGDDEPLSAVAPVSVTTTPGVTVTQLACGEDYTCALLSDGTVKCWGWNNAGQLGYGNTASIGDDELPSSVGPVSITKTPGVTAVSIAVWYQHTCALLSDDSVKCWGKNEHGQLGYGNTETIGDDELPSSIGPVSVTTTAGVTVKQLSLGYAHTCVLLSDGSVKCWGNANQGQLGYGNIERVGDNELPSAVGPVSVTTTPNVSARGITTGTFHTCAWLSDGSVKCWGHGAFGELGYGNVATIGDDELPSTISGLELAPPGEKVVALSAGAYHTCALFSDNSLKCWGANGSGQLGYGIATNLIGDDEPLSDFEPFKVTNAPGLSISSLAAGGDDTCTLLSDGSAKCWGFNQFGQLGDGNTEDIGDDELPSTLGSIVFF